MDSREPGLSQVEGAAVPTLNLSALHLRFLGIDLWLPVL